MKNQVFKFGLDAKLDVTLHRWVAVFEITTVMKTNHTVGAKFCDSERLCGGMKWMDFDISRLFRLGFSLAALAEIPTPFA
jgi:hypothetical protein